VCHSEPEARNLSCLHFSSPVGVRYAHEHFVVKIMSPFLAALPRRY
jgi:hypothetical protein